MALMVGWGESAGVVVRLKCGWVGLGLHVTLAWISAVRRKCRDNFISCNIVSSSTA